MAGFAKVLRLRRKTLGNPYQPPNLRTGTMRNAIVDYLGCLESRLRFDRFHKDCAESFRLVAVFTLRMGMYKLRGVGDHGVFTYGFQCTIPPLRSLYIAYRMYKLRRRVHVHRDPYVRDPPPIHRVCTYESRCTSPPLIQSLYIMYKLCRYSMGMWCGVTRRQWGL